MDSPDPVAIAGTEGASLPFFSPDEQGLGFLQGGKLVKVAVAGGPVTPIAPVGSQVYGATWTAGDTVVFATDSGLMDVPAAGGMPRVIARPDSGEAFRFPETLPGDRAVVFGVLTGNGLKLGALDRHGQGEAAGAAGRIPALRHRRTAGPERSGGPHDGRAVRCRPARGHRSGAADRRQPQHRWLGGIFNAGVSRSGDLVYQPVFSEGLRMVLVDRAGAAHNTGADSAFFYTPRLSPDGRRVAVLRGTSTAYVNFDIWIFDLAQRTQTRLTFDTSAAWPVWSPDGRRIVYTRFSEGTSNFAARLYGWRRTAAGRRSRW